LQKALEAYAKTDYTFDFERIYDARSSMGKMANSRTGDFQLYYKGKAICVELKEVAHDFRLPRSNFKKDQRARMRKRQLAGVLCRVVVYHSTIDRWRVLSLSHFDGDEPGSWDLSQNGHFPLESVLPCLLHNPE
jgi:hypothetical protein